MRIPAAGVCGRGDSKERGRREGVVERGPLVGRDLQRGQAGRDGRAAKEAGRGAVPDAALGIKRRKIYFLGFC